MTEPVCDTPIEEIARLNAECEALIPRITELEAECREWKEQCEKGDAKLVRECEEWREQCARLEEAAPTALGVPDADPVARITKKVNESLGAELADACDHIRALIGGDVGAILYAREWLEEHDHEEREPGPYAKAFRERVCPVPEFPGIEKEES